MVQDSGPRSPRDTETLMVQEHQRYRTFSDAGSPKVQELRWYRNLCGIGVSVVQESRWYSSLGGTGVPVLQKPPRNRGSGGTGISAVQGSVGKIPYSSDLRAEVRRCSVREADCWLLLLL